MRAEWSARVLLFTDMMLERLSEAWKAKDVDEKETRVLGNMIVKMVRLWYAALPAAPRDPCIPPSSDRSQKQASEEKTREE